MTSQKNPPNPFVTAHSAGKELLSTLDQQINVLVSSAQFEQNVSWWLDESVPKKGQTATVSLKSDANKAEGTGLSIDFVNRPQVNLISWEICW